MLGREQIRFSVGPRFVYLPPKTFVYVDVFVSSE